MFLSAALHRYECGWCGVEFEAPALPDMAYGEFLLWSDGGACAALDAVNCDEYSETRAMLTNLDPALGDNPFSAAEALQALFGPVVCDPAPDGTAFRIGLPPCPECGRRKGGAISRVEPLQAVETGHALTFQAWRSKSLTDRGRAICAFLDTQESGVS